MSKTSKSKFCSKSCAATFNNTGRVRSKDSKDNISKIMKAGIKSGKIPKGKPTVRWIYLYPYTRIYGYNPSCNHCNKPFWQISYKQHCCSTICRDNIRSQNKCRKKQIVFFNEYEGKNIILQSTWEEIIANWLTSNNIRWKRPDNRFKWFDITLDKNRTYLPDFFLIDYNVYLDVKNPIKQIEDADKISQLLSLLPLYVGDITEVKQYVVALTGHDPATSSFEDWHSIQLSYKAV